MNSSLASVRSFFAGNTINSTVDVPEVDMDLHSIMNMERPPLRKNPSQYGKVEISEFQGLCNGTVTPNNLQCCRLVQWCIENDEKNALVWWLEKAQMEWIRVDENHSNCVPVVAYLLSRSSFIRRLSLHYIDLTDELAERLGEALKKKPGLRSIELYSVQFESKALANLAAALPFQAALQEVTIYNCKLAEENLYGLVDALKGREGIALQVGANGMQPESIQHLFAAIRENDHIQCLQFSDEQVDEKNMNFIGQYVKASSALKRMHFVNNQCGSSILMRALTENNSITDLCIADAKLDSNIGTEIIDFLKKNRTVSRFSINVNAMDQKNVAEVAKGLKENNQLEKFSLYSASFNKEGATALASVFQTNTRLRSLILTNCKFESDAGEMLCKALSLNTTIEELILRGSNLSLEHQTRMEELCVRNRAAKRSMEQNDLLYSRINPSVALPPELGALISNHVLVLSNSAAEYESVTTEIALSIRALATDIQNGEGQAARAADRTQKAPEGCVLV